MVPVPWLSIVVSVAQACEITLSPDEMQATAHAVAPFLDAPYDPLVAAAIVQNYLLDAPGVHVLLTGPTHAAYQEVAETVCAWINEFRGRLYKDDSATIRATECANLDVLVWGDLQTHLVTFRYHGTLKSFVWSFVSQRWLRFLRDQAARRRGGEGVASRSTRMAQAAAGVFPQRRRDYVVSLEASDYGREHDGSKPGTLSGGAGRTLGNRAPAARGSSLAMRKARQRASTANDRGPLLPRA